MNKKLSIIIPYLIAFIAIGLRYYHWDITFVFHAEHNYKLWPMQQMIVSKKIPLIGTEAVSYIHHLHLPPFFLYIFAPILFFSKYNPASIEIALILFSGVTTYVFFLLGKEMRNVTFGYLTASIYAVSFLAQRTDRFVWIVGPIIFLTVLFFLIFLQILKKNKVSFMQFFILGSIISFGISFHYQIVQLLASFLLLLLIDTLFRKKIFTKKFIGFILGFIFFLLPLIVFDIRHNLYNLQGAIILITQVSGHTSFFIRLSNTLLAVGSIFLSLFIPQENFGLAVQNVIIAIPIVFFIYVLLILLNYHENNKANKILYWYFIMLISICHVFYFAILRKFPYYLLVLEPLFIIVFADLLYQCWNKRQLQITVFIFFASFVFINVRETIMFLPSLSWHTQVQAIQYIFDQTKRDSPSIYFESFPSEEYAFLLYYMAIKNKISYKTIKLYEPWQDENDAEFIFQPKNEYNGEKKVFGAITIIQRL